MIGKITKIDTLKTSRNKGEAFTRIYFTLKKAPGEYSWAKTDIVPSFRNYARWKPYLAVGTILDGLTLKGKDTIDADSRPTLVKRPVPGEELTKAEAKQAETQVVQGKLF